MLADLKIPESYADHLRIGTCSWKYDSWKGLVYTPDKQYRPDDYLLDYAKYFTTVEIDQWFWSLFPAGAKLRGPGHCETVCRQCARRLSVHRQGPERHHPDPFLCQAAQGPGSSLPTSPTDYFLSVDLLSRFLEILGAHARQARRRVMFQFEYLNKQKMPSLALHSWTGCTEFFCSRPRPGSSSPSRPAIPTTSRTEFFTGFLRRQLGLGFLLLDGYYMPRIAEVAAKDRYPHSLVLRSSASKAPTGSRSRRKPAGMWDKIVEPKDDGLKATVEIIRQNVNALAWTPTST